MQKSLECKAVKSYRASSSFENEVFRQAFGIHDELVLESRRILRETQRVPKDIVLLIGPVVHDIDDSVFYAPVIDAHLSMNMGGIEIIETLNSLQGSNVHDDL